MHKFPGWPTFLAALAALSAASASPAANEPPPFVPVFEKNFPDPFVIVHQGRFLAYATNSEGANVPMASSPNLVRWENVRDATDAKKLHDAMPVLPPWVQKGYTWAPEVMKIGGRFILYFTAREKKSGLQCVGTAASADPLGPFTSDAAEPFVCQRELGGTIDASPFRDADGKLYFYFKNDGNNPKARKPTDIFVQRLSADGLKLEGEPVALLRNDTPWEAHVVESPTMVRHPGGYTMLFSANHFGWEADQRLSAYAIGYAGCRGPMGPCTDAPENPILYSYNSREAGCLSGPGHQTVFEAAGRSFIAFHAWGATSGCRRTDAERYMYIAPLSWRGAKPLIAPSLRAKTGGK